MADGEGKLLATSLPYINLKNAIQYGLNVRLDSYTPGDGDCWYHAVVQQLRRPVIIAVINRKFAVIDRRDLREKVSSYTCDIQFHCPNILLYQPFFENNNNFTWEQCLNEQSSNNRMTGGICIMASAILIGLDIYIDSVQCNQSQPVNIIKRYWQEPDIPNRNDHPFLLIGHFQQHFQSLIPVTEMDTNQMFSYSEVVKHSTFTPKKGQEDKSNIDIVNSVEFSIKGDPSSTLPDNVIKIRKNPQPSSPKENISMPTFPPMQTGKVPVEGNTSDSLTDVVKKMKKCNQQCNPLKENILIRKCPQQLSLTLKKWTK